MSEDAVGSYSSCKHISIDSDILQGCQVQIVLGVCPEAFVSHHHSSETTERAR